VDDDEVHLMYGHTGMVKAVSVSVSADGRWIASGSRDGTIRLWPMPEGRPILSLPREEFLERLRALRSYQSVPNDTNPTGFDDVPVPFQGWEHEPPKW